jgi:hypothetical protein
MGRRRSRAKLGVLLVMAAMVATASLVVKLTEFWQPPLLYLRDFVQDWLWARALWDGVGPYTPTPALAARYLGDCCPVHLPHPSPHPPLAGLLVLPLSWLDLAAASAVWAGLEIACLAVAVGLLTRARWWMTLLITGALLAWHPLRTELAHGQFTTLQLLLVVLARPSVNAGHELRVGLLHGLTLSIKPIIAPLLLLYASPRQLRVLASAGATVAGLAVLALLAVGPEGTLQYLRDLPLTGQLYRDYPLNISIWSLGTRLAPEEPWLAAGLSLAAGGAFFAGAAWLLRRAQNPELAYGAAVTGSIILNPVAWDIYTILVLLPAIQVAQSLDRRGWPRPELSFVGLLAAGSLVPPGPQVPAWLGPVPTLVLAAFTFYLAWLALQPQPHAAPTLATDDRTPGRLATTGVSLPG